MATITNSHRTLRVNDTIYQKEDLLIEIEGDKIAFDDGRRKLSVLYSEISSPTSSDINDLLTTLEEYINESSFDFNTEVAIGRVPNASNVNKFGHNEDVDTGAWEIIASFGGTFDPTTNVITSSQTFTITYDTVTNGGDGSAGTGATSLLFTYLDENFLEATAIHALGSDGSDVTSFSGLGINRIVVLSSGSAGYNNNNITVTATTDGTNQAQIPAGMSVTHQCLYHTPINTTLLIYYLYANILKLSGSSPTVEVKMYSWSRVTLTRYEVAHIKIDTSIENNIKPLDSIPFIFTGREVIWLESLTDQNNTEVEARFSGNLIG